MYVPLRYKGYAISQSHSIFRSDTQSNFLINNLNTFSMKKLLLASLALVASVSIASADEVYFNADGNTIPNVEANQIVTMSGTTDKTGENALISKTWTKPGVCSVKFGMGTNTSNAPGIGTWKHFRIYINNTITITPAEGTTITGVTIRCTGASYAKGFSIDGTALTLEGTTYTWTGSKTSEFSLTSGGTNRAYYVLVSYTGGQEAVSDVTFSQPSGFVEAGTKIELATETQGASIYYTLNGTEPTANSTLYNGTPIEIESNVTIKAIGVKAGAVNSNVTSATYGILATKADAVNATYNFNDVTTLTPAVTFEDGSQEYALDETTLTAGEISLSVNSEAASTATRIFKSSADETTFRAYPGALITFTAENSLNNITFEGTTVALGLADDQEGLLIGNVWSAEEGTDVKSVTFKVLGNTTINTINVNYNGKSGGVENVGVEAAEQGVVKYYNLQGVEVANPESGLYIRVQGDKATKVIL